MKHTNLDEWKKDVEDKGYTVKQIQGYEQYQAWDGDRLVGHWATDYGTFEEPVEEPSPIVDATGEPVGHDPLVTETNVTDVQP
jgi:hypothetical protein